MNSPPNASHGLIPIGQNLPSSSLASCRRFSPAYERPKLRELRFLMTDTNERTVAAQEAVVHAPGVGADAVELQPVLPRRHPSAVLDRRSPLAVEPHHRLAVRLQARRSDDRSFDESRNAVR